MRTPRWRGAAALAVALGALLTVPAEHVTPAAPVTIRVSGPIRDTPPLRIMPMGASSTVGVGSPATAGYRGPLQEMLAADGIAVDLVGSQNDGPPSVPDRDHEGHSGWTLARMEPFVDGWVRAQRPDIVLLHAGTNDLLEGVSAAVAAQRLEAVLDDIHRSSDAYVVVAGVWAPLPGRTQARAEFARLAAALVARRRALGEPVGYADTATLLAPGDLTDELHADASGYRRIAAMWEQQIRAYLVTTRR